MSAGTAQLAKALHSIGAVRFGDFVLKDGRHSPFYIDLRVIIGDAAVLRQVAESLLRISKDLQFDCLAGIPYAGLPLAVAMALLGGHPVVYPRKEAKDYGTKKLIEGVFRRGQRALVVDDVITTGSAKLEAIAPLRDAGLIVEDIVVVIDREQGGSTALQQAGLRLHSVLPVSMLLRELHSIALVSDEQLDAALRFIAQ